MKKKIFTLFVTALIISLSAGAQTIKDNIDKAAKDKTTQDKATKADVLIHKNVIYDDSTKTTITPVKVVTKTYANDKLKYKTHNHKYKKKRTVSAKK